ncbi:MAG: manganese efflux pump [Candidatus Dormibacteraeota bacterium]|nr:manganese efflux pump [Candidatus Dormibacteraeota bacterium]
MPLTALKLLGFVLPLGVDSFAVAAAVGALGVGGRARLRVSLIFVLFEGGMPLIGVGLGAPLARAVGAIAGYVAIAVLIALGLWMLLSRGEEEEERAARLLSAHGLPLIGLGLSISLDELAIGFSLGLTGLPIAAVVVAIALQALVASQLGMALGGRLAERFREGLERVAGVVLILLGLALLGEALIGRAR